MLHETSAASRCFFVIYKNPGVRAAVMGTAREPLGKLIIYFSLNRAPEMTQKVAVKNQFGPRARARSFFSLLAAYAQQQYSSLWCMDIVLITPSLSSRRWMKYTHSIIIWAQVHLYFMYVRLCACSGGARQTIFIIFTLVSFIYTRHTNEILASNVVL